MIDVDQQMTAEARDINDEVEGVRLLTRPGPGLQGDGAMVLIAEIVWTDGREVSGRVGVLDLGAGIPIQSLPYRLLAAAVDGLPALLGGRAEPTEILAPPGPDAPVRDRIQWWAAWGACGISARTITRVMEGRPDYVDRPSHPHDVADLRRCLALLDLIPEWEARLPEVAVAYPMWGGLVREWSRLRRLVREGEISEAARLMHELIEGARRED